MTINSEQIQALKAAAESCDKQEPLSLVVYHGKMCLRNKGGIVFSVLRDICFPEYSAENENYARLAELCTSDSILSLLADRDADKALIAEHGARLIEYARIATEKRTRTLTIKLPQRQEPTSSGHYGEGYLVPCDDGVALNYDDTVDALREALAAAGITLVVGE